MPNVFTFASVLTSVALVSLAMPVACADEFDPPAFAGSFSGTVTGKVNWVHKSNWRSLWR